MQSARPGCTVLVAVLALSAAGCGKKGPPLAPYVRIPAAVQQISAQRSGNDVYVTLTLPSTNVDDSVPPAMTKVDVIAYTGRAVPSRARWKDAGTLVATIPLAGFTAPDGTVVAPEDAPAPGSVVTIVDALTPDELAEAPVVPPSRGSTPPKPAPAATETRAPQVEAPLRRFYVAFAVSQRLVPGPPGATAELTLSTVPDPPSGLAATYTATEMTLTWEPSGGTLGYLLENTALGPEASPLEEDDDRPSATGPASAMTPAGPVVYNVYRASDPDPEAEPPPAPKWTSQAPAPINPSPLTQLTMTDAVQFDRRVCYTVAAVRGTGAQAVQSARSEPRCLTPIDTFPPAPPRALAAVPSAESINLIWEASEDADVVGYLVLRGAPGDATLQSLTPAAIPDARYRDASVKPGVSYVYAVVAVDSRKPTPNVSAESNRVEETAR